MIEELEVARQGVARKVADDLEDRRPGGMTLEVDPQRIRKREHEWQVVVRPSEEPPKLSEYYEALADVETALEACEQLKVFLVPGEPKHLPSGEDEDDATRPSSTPER